MAGFLITVWYGEKEKRLKERSGCGRICAVASGSKKYGRSWKGSELNRRITGKNYEVIAEDYLKEQGIYILAKNYRSCQGEVDLIAESPEYVIFVEVKYRKDNTYGEPWEAVSIMKQKKICKVARQFCYTRNITKQIRYDVISICGDDIFWFQDAFLHLGN